MTAKTATPITENAMLQMACFGEHPAVECLGDLCAKLESDRARLVEALRATLLHESTLVGIINGAGEASPHAFHLACEQAHSLLRELEARK